MRILIADRSRIALVQLERKLAKQGIDVVHQTSSLASVYDYSEHHQPDCVILSMDLADCPEFELLASLFAILGITCLLTTTSIYQTIPAAAAKANPDIRCISQDASDTAIMLAMRRSKMQRHESLSTAKQSTASHTDPRAIILIGSSTGGIDALMQILRHFNKDSPPTMIVQHTGGQFAESLIRLMNGATQAQVVAAAQNAVLRPGHIYLSATDTHHIQLAANAPLRIRLNDAPRISGHRPSIDALFQSAINHAPNVSAAILTGMGRDGAEGITALRQAGARTVGQDEQSCVVYGMPRIAKLLGGIEKELPITQIGPALLSAQTHKARQP